MDVPVAQGQSTVPDWAGGGNRSQQPDKITGPQREYIHSLLNKHILVSEDKDMELRERLMKQLQISEDPEEVGITKVKASQIISWLKQQPLQTKISTVQPQSELPDVPAGRYAVNNADGTLRFYTVDKPTEGRWVGYTFVNVWASDEKHPIRAFETRKQILSEIAKDPKAAAERFGQEIGSCGICGRTLTDETSRAIGIGPVCRANSEWY